ncbi:MAG: hypothetical protein ACFFCW_33780 [Candidatus Hodarchaeota archaeon]
MCGDVPATNSSKIEPTFMFLIERIRVFTNYWVFPTILFSMFLIRALFAYLGGYIDLVVAELPATGTLWLFLLYLLFIMRFVFRYVRNTFGLNSTTISPLNTLFINDDAFKKYQEKVQSNLFGKEKIFLFWCTIFSVGYYAFTELFISGTFGKPYGTVESPIGFLDYSFSFFMFGFIAFIIGDIIWIFLGILRSIHGIAAEKLTIAEYVNTLKSSMNVEGRGVGISDLGSNAFSYEQFHRQMKVIGRFCLTLALLLMGGAFLYGIWWVIFIRLYNAQWMIGEVISLVSASFLYFVIPQWSLHQLLTKTKEDILNHFKDSYEAIKKTYMQKLAIASSNIDDEDLVSIKELDLLIRRMELMKTVVSDTDEVSPWPYDLDQLLRLVVAGAIPFILILLERILADVEL